MKALVLLSLICAYGQIATPRIGAVLEGGSLRPIYGVAGSFVLGAEIAGDVRSSACSAERCVIKTDIAIEWDGVAAPAPPGTAVIGLGKDVAWIYFRDAGSFARLERGALMPLDWHVDGEVLSIASDQRIAVRKESGVWIVRPDGGTVDSLPDATGPVLLFTERTIFATAAELVVQRADRSQARLPLAGVEAITAMGERWAQVTTSAAIYALDIERDKLYLLPLAETRRRRP